MSKTPVEQSPKQFLATKYQISKHLGLLESFPKREALPENLKILVSHYLNPIY
jgi:hypothetical protein